jgi:phosphonate ABC transporter permease subunit PhnE
MSNNKTVLKSLRLALAVLLGLIIYAYGFQVTQVSTIEKMQEPRRQEQFVRILRALFRPDLLEYEQQEVRIEAPIFIPCPPGELELPEPDVSSPHLVITPACADPASEIQVEGVNFAPNSKGPLNLIPPSQVTLQLGQFETDSTGHFIATYKLPRRQPVAEAQHIRAITRTNVGAPRLTQTAKDTWNKIVETVFLALLATTMGTALAIPVSFLAARNIMKEITSPLASVALALLAWPTGMGLGIAVTRWIGILSRQITASASLSIAGLIVAPLIVLGVVRWSLPQEESRQPGLALRVARLAAGLIAAMAAVLALYLLAHLAGLFGDFLEKPLGPLGFVGSFVANLGEILHIIVIVFVSLAAGAALSGPASKLGQVLTDRLPGPTLKVANLVLGATAGSALLALIGAAVQWIYLLNDPLKTFWLPAGCGALIGLALAFRTPAKEPLPIGLVIYTIVRTILNTLRSIEAFIMAIVFVVLVSTGPFAGVLALGLHTIASLAKLYSEQVESILPGPLEAVQATGATRLQTILYAVIPQIIPPYISFTMYRWDINVRMSTIIGFAGGGGIGFLLQQNINLLNYRAASAQMLAIAIVVGAMDYLSSTMRERFV